jgi:hypothetical protein
MRLFGWNVYVICSELPYRRGGDWIEDVFSKVRRVCAHTLPEENASTGVLTKCGFRKTGELMDPDDGLVWRREKTKRLTDAVMHEAAFFKQRLVCGWVLLIVAA